MTPPAISASLTGRRRAVFIVLLLLLGGVVWAARHVMTLANAGEGDTREFAVVFVGAFLLLAWQLAWRIWNDRFG